MAATDSFDNNTVCDKTRAAVDRHTAVAPGLTGGLGTQSGKHDTRLLRPHGVESPHAAPIVAEHEASRLPEHQQGHQVRKRGHQDVGHVELVHQVLGLRVMCAMRGKERKMNRLWLPRLDGTWPPSPNGGWAWAWLLDTKWSSNTFQSFSRCEVNRHPPRTKCFQHLQLHERVLYSLDLHS